MLRRIKKELRPLVVPWVLAAIGAVLLLFRNNFEPGGPFGSLGFDLAPVLFAIACAVLAGVPFGTEFQARTFPLLLSQPVSRARIWSEKLAALGICAGALLIIFGAVLVFETIAASGANELTLPVDRWQIVLPAGLLMMPLFCSAAFWTLTAGTTIGGIVLTAGGLTVATLLTHALETAISRRLAQDEVTAAGGWTALLWVAVALGYSALFLWLGWRKFRLFEVRQALVAEGSGVLPAATSGGVPEFLRFRAKGAYANLVRKELYLYRPMIGVATFFLICWLTLLGLSTVHALKPETAETLFGVWTLFYMAIVLCLCGCISLGEEKGLGIHGWHMTLPVSVWRQWLVKLTVALGMGLALGVVFPFVLSWATAWQAKPPLALALKDPHGALLVVLISLATLVSSFWSASLLSSTVRAAVGCFAILTGAFGCVTLANWAAQQFGGLQVQALLSSATHSRRWFSLAEISGDLLLVAAFAAIIPFMLAQTRFLFRRTQVSARLAWLHSALLAAVVLAISFWASDYKVSALEVRTGGTRFLQEMTTALMALPTPHPGPSKKQMVSIAELTQTGKLSQATLTWLDSATIWIGVVEGRARGQRPVPVYMVYIHFPEGQELSFPFQH